MIVGIIFFSLALAAADLSSGQEAAASEPVVDTGVVVMPNYYSGYYYPCYNEYLNRNKRFSSNPAEKISYELRILQDVLRQGFKDITAVTRNVIGAIDGHMSERNSMKGDTPHPQSKPKDAESFLI